MHGGPYIASFQPVSSSRSRTRSIFVHKLEGLSNVYGTSIILEKALYDRAIEKKIGHGFCMWKSNNVLPIRKKKIPRHIIILFISLLY